MFSMYGYIHGSVVRDYYTHVAVISSKDRRAFTGSTAFRCVPQHVNFHFLKTFPPGR